MCLTIGLEIIFKPLYINYYQNVKMSLALIQSEFLEPRVFDNKELNYN